MRDDSVMTVPQRAFEDRSIDPGTPAAGIDMPDAHPQFTYMEGIQVRGGFQYL